MKIYFYPQEQEMNMLLRRATESCDVRERVSDILRQVRECGDSAIVELTKQIDNVELTQLEVPAEEIERAKTAVSEPLRQAINIAKQNIEAFHKAQVHQEVRVETMKGVECWQRAIAIDRVGLYIPSGSAPLFSTVLMLALPAKIAGVKEIILCTPTPAPEILYTAALCGVTKIYSVGGAMAIGAMAYGTETIKKVDKIFGPGNNYVTTAKQLVSLYDVSIDMPAGPSEVMILADRSANAAFVAADLLSQAEHGIDSQAIAVTDDIDLATDIWASFDTQRQLIPRPIGECRVIVVKNSQEMVEISNRYAPEHLIISMLDADNIAEKIRAAGSIFIGNYTPESAGDYASGTNHTLPTGGWARSCSGVNLDSFIKKITYQKISYEGLKIIGKTIEEMAKAEGLEAHKNAVTIRISDK